MICNPAPFWRSWLGVIVVLAVVTALYSAPFAGIALRLGSSGLVPLLDADTYLYTAISRQTIESDGQVENPWYGNRLPAANVTYLRFGRAIAAYGLLEGIVGPELAMPFWCAAFTLMIALASYWLSRRVFELSRLGAANAVLFLTLVNLRYDLHDAAALLRGTEHAIYHYGLPYRRPFFPQVGVIVALGYLALLPRALATGSIRAYAALVLLQFVGVLTFPYVTLLCALATAFAGAMLRFQRAEFHVKPYLAYGALCAIIDLGYLSLGPALVGPGAPGEPLFRWDPTWLSLDGLHGLLPLTVVAAIAAKATPREVRLPVIGFALAIPIASWSDAFVLTLQIGHHAQYFTALAAGLLLILLAKAIIQRIRGEWPHYAGLAFALACIAWGAVQSTSTYRFWKPINEANGLLATKMQELQLTRDDVVIEPVPAFLSARSPPYWESSPIPLVSPARTLLTSGARFLLLPGDVDIHLEREALYLFLAGHDETSLGQLLRPVEPPSTEQFFLAGYGREFALLGTRREHVLRSVQEELLPRLRRLGEDPRADALGNGRIVIVDLAEKRTFRADRVTRLFVHGEPERRGPWLIWVGVRRPSVR